MKTITRTFALLAASLSILPPIAAGAQAAGQKPPLASTVDPNIKPGDDFYAYANGAWLKATQIPAGKLRWGARDEINELTSLRVTNLLNAARTAPAGSLARKIADYRDAYQNEAAIDAAGIAPLKPSLDSIDRVADKLALARLLGSGLGTDVDPLNWGTYTSSHLLGLAVTESIHDEKNYVAFLVQGGLGLPDRENYLTDDAPMKALRAKYRAYVSRALALAGFDHADERAERVIALETAIARTHTKHEVSENDRNADNVWTRADFSHNAPGLDWTSFFAAAGMAKQETFAVWQPSAVKGVGELVASESLEAWKDYLRFHLIDRYADVLPRAFAGEALALRVATGQSKEAPRAQRALEATQLALGDAIGRLYVEHFFPADQKARVRTIVSNVAAAFAKRVESVKWMGPAARKIALAKLRVLYVGIGYPEHWQDYSNLTIKPADAIGNLRRVEARNYNRLVTRIGKPINTAEWLIPSQPAAAVLIFQLNAYDFSAALLQAPKFDASASDAANYGAIGAIIGHDVSHYVDVLGADYDADGGMHHWWTADDSARFQAAAAPLVDQFSSYHPFPDLAVNGKLSETENVADLAGLNAAFDAYRATLGSRAGDKAYVKQQDREFFIAFAQSYRAQIGEKSMRSQAVSDHAPEPYRAFTVRNLDAWYDAFDVQPGQRLYLEPKARARIW